MFMYVEDEVERTYNCGMTEDEAVPYILNRFEKMKHDLVPVAFANREHILAKFNERTIRSMYNQISKYTGGRALRISDMY
jgi:UDP-N-acetyl-D-mannosaminuronic acid transferase (WecB/TagA/CpsF family)